MLIDILEERHFPVKRLIPLASERSVGGVIQFRGEEIPVVEATPEAFSGIDIVLASAGASVSAKLVPEAVTRGAIVIDNTSHFRMDPNVPLVVAGVNDEALHTHKGIIANPNCSTAQLMPVLKALHPLGDLKRVIISSYQSVSGAGKEAMEELRQTTQRVLASDEALLGDHTVFARSMAFNLIPQIDVFLEDGYTKEEAKLINETKKILGLPELAITATAVRVPVMVGHSEAVTIEFERPVSPQAALDALKLTPDVVVAERPEDFPTPRETAGTDPVYVGRVREDSSNPETGLNVWVVADNLRIGAALNAVRIAERLIAFDLLKKDFSHV